MRNSTLYPIALLALLCGSALNAQQKIPNMARGDLPFYVDVVNNVETACQENALWITNASNIIICSPWTWLATGECTGANGGALTINASNQVVCSDDDSGATFVPDADPGVDHSGYVAGHAAAALRTVCANIDPTHAITDWLVYRADQAVTVTGIDCLVAAATSVVLTIQECDGNGANCTAVEAAITCGATNTTESGGIDDATIDAGDWLRVLRGTVTGTPEQAVVCISFEVAG